MANRVSKLNKRAIAEAKAVKNRQQIQAKVFQGFDEKMLETAERPKKQLK